MGPNEAIVRDAYGHYSRGDFVSKLPIFADAIVWRSAGAPNRLTTAGERRGFDGVRDYFAALFEGWDIRAFSLSDLIVQDDRRFAARVSVTLRRKDGKAQVTLDKVDLLTMENGKCTSFSEVFDAGRLERAARS